MVEHYCESGVPVQYRRVLNDHLLLTITGYPGALRYLSDRIAGIPAPSNCD